MVNCARCSLEFFSKHKNARFCSKECSLENLKEKYHLEKHLKKEKKKKLDLNCLNCSELMKNVLPHRKYCSKKCKIKYQSKQMGFDKYENENLNNISRGAMNEMIVCADLIRNGFEVFKAIANNSCDLAILKNKTLYRVEVTSGNIYSKNGKVHIPTKDVNKHDILAVVLRNGEIIYTPKLQEIKDQT